jgi:hypothetical protein
MHTLHAAGTEFPPNLPNFLALLIWFLAVHALAFAALIALASINQAGSRVERTPTKDVSLELRPSLEPFPFPSNRLSVVQ